MLLIEELTVHYGNMLALDKVSLEVEAGRIVAIIGANGSGKSTLLNTVAGAIRPSGGSIRLEGTALTGLSSDRVVGRGISLVPEGRQVFASLPVIDNLLLGAYLHRRPQNRVANQRRLDMVYQLFPRLKERIGQPAGTLSGGEQQMLAIGRSLMSRPRLMLLDEPSLGLAPLLIREIFQTLIELNEQGTTILLVEQNARAALEISHYAYALETGRVVQAGPARDLLDDPAIIEAYLGGGERMPNG